MKMKTLKIKEETHKKLTRILSQSMLEKGQRTTYDEAIITLILKNQEIKSSIKFNKKITYQEDRNRFNITFYPSDIEQLKKASIEIKKGSEINVSINK